MTQPSIRLSPSGPPIGNAAGGPLSFGPGARLRLVEATSPMTGDLILPTTPGVIGPGGFGDLLGAVICQLPAPKAEYDYRAELTLDLQNIATNGGGEVILYLDISRDEGATWENRVSNSHVVMSGQQGGGTTADNHARPCSIWMPKTSGAALALVTDSTPSLRLRARAQAAIGNPNVVVYSPGNVGGIVGLSGTIHLQLEETF
jgi:hypothetical protein